MGIIRTLNCTLRAKTMIKLVNIRLLLKYAIIAVFFSLLVYYLCAVFHVDKSVSIPTYYEVGNDSAAWKIGFK